MLGKYDNYAKRAWNHLRDRACIFMEKYDNWQMVLPGVVAFHAPLGEFHLAWCMSSMASTIIVLGKFQPKSCRVYPGSTIIRAKFPLGDIQADSIINQIKIRIMYKKLVLWLRKHEMYSVLLIMIRIERKTRFRLSEEKLNSWYETGRFSREVAREIRISFGPFSEWSKLSLDDKRDILCSVCYY